MKKEVLKEINKIKHLSSYKPGKIISERRETEEEERKRFTCEDCGEYDYKMYMVNKALWNKYGNKEKTLCWDCLEKRMGRKLTKYDFEQYKDTPVNKYNKEVQALY